MCVRPYICKITGETRYEAYVNHRSDFDPSVRIQMYKRCKTEASALKAEKELIKQAAKKCYDKEMRGTRWSVVAHQWEAKAKELKRNPTTLKPICDRSITNVMSILGVWTKDWFDKPTPELSIKDGRDLLLKAVGEDLQPATIRKIKTYVNLVYKYGVQEGIIPGNSHSPVHGVPFDLSDSGTLPEILTRSQSSKLLVEGKSRGHKWFPIWATALMTGMRSSELYALTKENVDLEEGLIKVSVSWDWANNCAKSTKSRYWRTAPINSTLRPIIEELMAEDPTSPFLFPRLKEWNEGSQASVLRKFCEEIGIPSVRFHTLRACFATHMLILGVDQGTIMAIGGWSDFKTFRIYVRLAGVTERHKTEGLGKLLLPAYEPVLIDEAGASRISTEIPRSA